MDNMNWNYPTPIWFGLNRVNEIQKACENLNINNPLIVTDPGILKTNIISKVNNSLAKEASIYSDVQGNPTGSNVMNGVEVFNNGKMIRRMDLDFFLTKMEIYMKVNM